MLRGCETLSTYSNNNRIITRTNDTVKTRDGTNPNEETKKKKMKKINEMNGYLNLIKKRPGDSARLKIPDPNNTPERLSRYLRSPTWEIDRYEGCGRAI